MGAPDLKAAMTAVVSPKYKLDRKDFVTAKDGTKLYRIVALRNFGDVEKGQKGGYIQHEGNLSQHGDCWVAERAKVYHQARVEKNALACDYVEIYEQALMTDDSMASGHADLSGRCRMLDNSEATDHTRIFGAAELCENGRAGDYSVISGRCRIGGGVYVRGDSVVAGTMKLDGNQVLDRGVWTGQEERGAPN